MNNYLRLLSKVGNEGVFRRTRTGAVRSLFNPPQLEWDLRDGFPAVTTKKLNFNGVAAELLMFLSGKSDRRVMQEFQHGDFKEDRNDIWKGDCERAAESNPERFNGYNLGDMYSTMWRQLPVEPHGYQKIKPRRDLDAGYVEVYPELVEPGGDHELIGKIFESNKCGRFRVISSEYIKEKQSTSFTVQFLETGYINSCWNTKDHIKKGFVKDNLLKSKYGGSYLGCGPTKNRKVYALWKAMIDRCYYPKNDSYGSYGGKGVTVSPRWLKYENFYKDVFCLPNFQEWVGDSTAWVLDKDFYSGVVYSRNTCLFIPYELNLKLNGNAIIVDDTFYMSQAEAYNSLGISRNNGRNKLIKAGAIFLEDTDKVLHRPMIFKDQIADLIYNIKHNPTSRSLLVTNYNPEWSRKCVLPACHTHLQCYVGMGEDGQPKYLDMSFNMRSSDIFLGLPYNIASYSLLLEILARLTGLIPRKLTCTLGDAHLYENHLEQANEQLKREPYELPELYMPPFGTLEGLLKRYTAKDFVLQNYKSYPAIKAPLSVGV